MNTNHPDNKPTESMFEKAADWASLAQSGSMQAQDAANLQHWLDADGRHRAAYARMQSLLDLTAGMELASPAPADRDDGRRRQSWRRWSRAGLGIAAGLAAIVIAMTRLYPLTDESLITDSGELRTVALADGSSITLRGDSRLHIRYGLTSRRVVIDRGEAAFDIAHERFREFAVESSDVRVIALGTVFNVQVMDGLSTVTLVEGSVEVDDRKAGTGNAAAPGEPLVLAPGEQVVFAADGSHNEVRRADIAQVTAWQDGRIVLRRRPLAELVDELNRSFAGQIRIEDPSLSAIPVNVSMHLEDRDTTLMRLEQQLPITFQPLDHDRFLVHRKTAP